MGGIPSSRIRPAAAAITTYVNGSRAEAGVNGTFFDVDNHPLGPAWASDAAPGGSDLALKWKVLTGRPLVAWNSDTIVFAPYEPTRTIKRLREKWPETVPARLSSGFVAGDWLVHGGVACARPAPVMKELDDRKDRRPRAFFGVTQKGVPLAGATIDPVDVRMLAAIAREAGSWEAVLLDSGYSTALVFRGQLIVSGASAPGHKPRPVPHAILFFPLSAQSH